MAYRTWKRSCRLPTAPWRWRATRRSARTSIRRVPSEFSNWMDEQVAWRETAALFDQTHHMTDVYIAGPDVIKLLSDLGVNTFANFQVGKAKQFVACNHDGYVIGDAILFFLDENRVSLVGRPSAHNWVQFHAETGDYDVSVERDERTAANPTGRRKIYRFQVQGPTALDVLKKANGGSLPEIKFFNLGKLTLGGHKVRALHHGMSGVPGLELFGPWDEMEDVRGAIVEAGRDYGLRQVGSRVYATNTLESGWIPCPLPAIFTGDELKAYREWLPADGYEGTGSLGGSYYADDISDYYATPHDLGYWPFVKFDHDFVGRDALKAMADEPERKKVTLAWSGADVASAMGSRCSRRGKRSSTSTSRCRTTRPGRTTSSSTTARSLASRRSPATATTSARCSRSATSTSTCRSGRSSSWCGARRAVGRPSRSSSGTGRPRFESS